MLCIYINYTIVGGLQILARNDVIILVMRGLDNFSGGFVWVAIRPSGKADLFQQEQRLAQEQRTTFLLCGTCHRLNAKVQSGPPETFLGLQFPNYKLSSPQELSKQESVWWFRWGKAQVTQENFFFEKSGLNVLLKSGLFHVPLRVFASSIACASLLGCAGKTTQQAESVWGSCSGFRLCRTPSDGCHKSAFQSAPILQPNPSGQTIGLGNRGRGQFTKSKFT